MTPAVSPRGVRCEDPPPRTPLGVRPADLDFAGTLPLGVRLPKRLANSQARLMRVYGYVRVSTDEQANSRAGLDAQRAAILIEYHRMDENPIWRRDLRQMPTRMAALPAGLAPRRTPQTLRRRRRRFGQPIRGRRPRRVPRVAAQPSLQPSDLGLQPNDLALRRSIVAACSTTNAASCPIRRLRRQGHITTFPANGPIPAPPEQLRFAMIVS